MLFVYVVMMKVLIADGFENALLKNHSSVNACFRLTTIDHVHITLLLEFTLSEFSDCQNTLSDKLTTKKYSRKQ